MKTTPEGHGNSVPGELGKALPQRKEWTELDEKCRRRKMAEGMVQEGGGYRIWTDADGKMHAERLP